MAGKIIGLRGTDLGEVPLVDPPRPAMTLAGTLMLVGSIGVVGYIFYWAAFGKGPKKSGFARNGRRHYRARSRSRKRRS